MWLLGWLAAAAAALVALAVAGRLALRRAADVVVDRVVERLMTEPYAENLWEVVAGFGHSPPIQTLENALRARDGRALYRPIGTPRRFRDFSALLFRPAQLVRPALQPDAPVDTRVTIGPRARRPVELDIPVLLGGMAYGLAVSEAVTLALARGSALAGTAYNTGNGPLLPAVRQEARTLVIQYTGAPWTTRLDVLRRADMIEIRFGRGAWAGMGHIVPPGEVPPEAAELMGVQPGEEVRIPKGPLSRPSARTLRQLVRYLRAVTGGVPVGVKIAAGHDLEAELDVLLAAGVDFVAIDGAQGGTHNAPAILEDDFGLPTLHALCRARRHLDRRGAGRDVTLLVGGGLLTPGECLKCLALGADAVYLGTSALFAAVHAQVMRALPWEPPTAVAWAAGPAARDFDAEEGARNLARFLAALTDEMCIGARALGKRALRDVSAGDLVALDPETAAITGVPLAYRAATRLRIRRMSRPAASETSGTPSRQSRAP